MTNKGLETADRLNQRLDDLEQRRQDVFSLSLSDPVIHLHGLSAERIEKIKAIALALYDAEIAIARAKVHFLGVAREAA